MSAVIGRCECEGWIGRWAYHGRNDPPDTFRCSDCERVIEEKFVPESQLQGAVEERDRLRALLKQAHDRDKWLGEMPPIAWYDEVARYFRGQ